MADVTKSVEVIFSTGLADDGSAIRNLGQGIDDFASKAQAVVGPLNSMADAVKIADTAIIGLGIAFAGQALQAAGQFNQQISGIGTLFDATSGQLKTLSGDVLNYAATSTQSISQITSSISQAVGAGLEWTKSIEFLTTAEKLAVGGAADLSSSTTLLIGTMNAYGAQASEAGKFSDILFQTVKDGVTTIPALAQSLSNVTATAAAAKIPFSDVGAAVAALTASGLPTAQAITALNSAISNIIGPSQTAAETAASLGIKFNAAELASKGLAGVFGEVYTATGGNIEQINKLFGSLDGLKAATVLGADASGLYATALNHMKDASGSTQAAFELLANSWDNVNQRLKNNIDTLLITAGDKLGTQFTGIVNGLGDVFKSLTFSLNAGAFDTVFATLGTFSTQLAALFKQMAENLPAALAQVDFTKFNSALVNLADSLGGIFKGVDLTTPEGLAHVIQIVTDSIATLINMGAGIADTWAAVFQKAEPLIEQFSRMSQETANTTGKTLGLADVLSILLPAFENVGKGLVAIGGAMAELANIKIVQLTGSIGSAVLQFLAIEGRAYALGAALGYVGGPLAAGAVGYGFGTLINDGLNSVIGKLTGGQSLGTLIFDLTHGTQDLAAAATSAGPAIKDVGDRLDQMARVAGTAAAATTELRDSARASTTDLLTVGGNLTELGVAAQKWADGQVLAASKAGFLSAASSELTKVTQGAIEAQSALISGMDGRITKTQALSQSEEAASATSGAFAATAAAVADAQGRATNSITTYGAAVSTSDTAIATFTQTVSSSRDALNNAAQAFLDNADKAGYNAAAHALVRAEYEKLDAAATKNVASTSSFSDALAAAGTAAGNDAKQLLEVTKAASDYEVKMAQIEATLAGKVIESKLKLDIADVESNAKIAVAILDNIAKTFDSDTKLIGDLLSQVKDGYSTADQIRIKFAEAAEKRVDELHEGQMKIIAAQVAYLYAKTAALVNGDPILTINANGLEPALEAFMWEVLKKIQVKMAMDGSNAILGGLPAF